MSIHKPERRYRNICGEIVAALSRFSILRRKKLHLWLLSCSWNAYFLHFESYFSHSEHKCQRFFFFQYDEEVERLKTTGIRTKTHTVELCRLMYRTTDLNTRLTLANLLIKADKPCRRLFLDYQGLKILRGWMSELGWTLKDLELKIAIEDMLSSLDILNRTMLTESKILQLMTAWSTAACEADIKSAQNSRAASPTNSEVKNSTPATPISGAATPSNSTTATPISSATATPLASQDKSDLR